MWSLASIFSNIARGSLNPQDVISLLEATNKHFKDFNTDNAIDVMTEMAPEENIEIISEKLNELLNKLPEGMMMGETGYALTTLAAVVENKLNIKNKTVLSLREEIFKFESDLSSESPRATRSKKLRELRHLIIVADRIQAESIDSRIACQHANISMLNDIISNSPEFIKNHIQTNTILTTFLDKYNHHFQDLISASTTPNNETHILLLCEACDRDAEILFIQISTAIKSRLNEIRSQISAGSLLSLEERYDALLQQINLLLGPEHISSAAYKLLCDKFSETAKLLIQETIAEPDSPKEVSFRAQDEKAKLEVSSQFEWEKYNYYLSAHDLRKSKNTFIQGQVALTERNFGSVLDENKFLLSARPNPSGKNNLKQIKKDMARGLDLAGESYHDQQFEDEDLVEILKTKFGENNTNNLLKHYDQGLSYMVAGAVAQGFADEDMMNVDNITVKQPTDFSQNIYLHNEIAYRTVTLGGFRLTVPQDNRQKEWELKVNLKAFSWLNEDGFSIECIATDNPLICFALMSGDDPTLMSPKKLLEDVVAIVLEAENFFTRKMEKLNLAFAKAIENPRRSASGIFKDIKPILKLKIDALVTSLQAIKEFKTGKITLDLLIDEINQISKTLQAEQDKRRDTPDRAHDSPTLAHIKSALENFKQYKHVLDSLAEPFKQNDTKQTFTSLARRRSTF